MADLPRWTYIFIIVCAEIILAVIVTLVIVWRCRLAKGKRPDDKEKLQSTMVEEFTDDEDEMNNSNPVVVGHAPKQHEYKDQDPFISESKEKELSPGPIVCANSAFATIDKQDKASVEFDSNPKGNEKLETPQTFTNDQEGDCAEENPQSVSENTTPDTENENRPNTAKAATAIYTTNQLFTTTNHGQQMSRENSRLTPVEFEMKDLESQSRTGTPVEQSGRSTPVLVKSITPSPATPAPIAVKPQTNAERPPTKQIQGTPIPSYEESQHFTSESQFRQFQREMFMLRSPPPTYQSSLGGQ